MLASQAERDVQVYTQAAYVVPRFKEEDRAANGGGGGGGEVAESWIIETGKRKLGKCKQVTSQLLGWLNIYLYITRTHVSTWTWGSTGMAAAVADAAAALAAGIKRMAAAAAFVSDRWNQPTSQLEEHLYLYCLYEYIRTDVCLISSSMWTQ